MSQTFAPFSLSKRLREVADGASASRLVEEAAERADAADGTLRAFVHRPVRKEWAVPSGPLAGAAIGVKDIFDTADMPTAYGSPIYAGHRPAADAPLVAMARAAGATILGKTETTEFAFLQPAPTRNPHDPDRTPGGSSAGSAAAVAAGLIDGAFGSQTAGSIIRPASFCGVAGYKPSFRLLPGIGMKSFAWTLDTAGLFAASVPDVALLATLISGRDLTVDAVPSLSGVRVGLYRSAVDDQLEPEMAGAINRAARLIEAAGAVIVDILEPQALTQARIAQSRIQIYEASIALLDERRRHSDQLSDALRAALDEGAAIGPDAYDADRRTARIARRESAALWTDVEILVAPSALGAAPARDTTGDPVMNRLWTLLGNPCVNVPGLCASNGLPLGLSVVARFGRDRLALSLSAAIGAILSHDSER